MVKRISRGVRRRPEISEAAKLFAEALKLRDHREDAIDDDRSCPGRGRCGTCDHYEELVAKIANILGLSVDEVHPLDVGDIEPPPWWELNQIEAWEGARRLYVDLCAAAGVEPQRRLAMREFDEGQTIVRWIERMIPTPAGLSWLWCAAAPTRLAAGYCSAHLRQSGQEDPRCSRRRRSKLILNGRTRSHGTA